jgi:hypothetical protein
VNRKRGFLDRIGLMGPMGLMGKKRHISNGFIRVYRKSI